LCPQIAMAKAHAAVMAAPKPSRMRSSADDPVEQGWTNKALAKAGVNLDGGIFRAKKPSKLVEKKDGAAPIKPATASKLKVVPADASTELAQTGARVSRRAPKMSKEIKDKARVDAFEEQQTISQDDGTPPQPVLAEASTQEGYKM
jgi:hypothetical protein